MALLIVFTRSRRLTEMAAQCLDQYFRRWILWRLNKFLVLSTILNQCLKIELMIHLDKFGVCGCMLAIDLTIKLCYVGNLKIIGYSHVRYDACITLINIETSIGIKIFTRWNIISHLFLAKTKYSTIHYTILPFLIYEQ